jgi:uncharacterized membrane protein
MHAPLVSKGAVMFGFIIGTLCLLGFIGVYKHGRRRRFAGLAPWRLFQKLDTSPAQERVVRNALDSVKGSAKSFADSGQRSRGELADLLRSPDFDTQRVSAWFMAREQELTRVRETAVAALGEIYEVLDDQQRAKLAHLIERGSFWPRACRNHGPYRSQTQEAV